MSEVLTNVNGRLLCSACKSQHESAHIYLTWEHISHITHNLAHMLKNSCHMYGHARIAGVSRGGLVPATILAHHMDRHDVVSIPASRRKVEEGLFETRLGRVDQKLHQSDGNGWIIVDDILDTGATFEALRYRWPRATFAFLTSKKLEEGIYIGEQFIGSTRWIVFPWEDV